MDKPGSSGDARGREETPPREAVAFWRRISTRLSIERPRAGRD